MQIAVKDAERGMIINDGKQDVLVNEVWDQGVGLGIVIKGMDMDTGATYHRRFLNPELIIEMNSRNMT